MRREIVLAGIPGLIASLLFVVPASAQLRPQIVRPLREAQPLIEEGKFNAAKAEVDKADAVPNKTPDETKIISQMRDYIGVKSRDSQP